MAIAIVAGVLVLLAVGVVAMLVFVAGDSDSGFGFGGSGTSSPQYINVGEVAQGSFGSGVASDGTRSYVEYLFSINTPGEYVISLDSSDTDTYDPYLYLYQNGTEIDRNDDGGGGLNSRLSKSLQPGTYAIRVSSFGGSTPSFAVGYTLSLTGPPQIPGAPIPPPPSSQGQPVAINVPITGTFSPGLPLDERRYPYIDHPLTVTTSGQYRISLVGSGSHYDPYLRLRQNGVEIDTDDDGGQGRNSLVTRMLSPGQYTVRVTKFGSGQISEPAMYTLTVNADHVPQNPTAPGGAVPGAITTGGPIQAGQSVVGLFDPTLPTDRRGYPYVDYTLQVTRPGEFMIDLMAQGSGYDPYLRLLRRGREIETDDDGGQGLNSRIARRLPPGSYTIRVTKFRSGAISQPARFTLMVAGPPQG